MIRLNAGVAVNHVIWEKLDMQKIVLVTVCLASLYSSPAESRCVASTLDADNIFYTAMDNYYSVVNATGQPTMCTNE